MTDLLRQRAAAREAEFAATAKQLAEVRRHDVPRVTLLEVEYVQTLRRTEIRWLTGVADDIAAGDLPWPSPDEPT